MSIPLKSPSSNSNGSTRTCNSTSHAVSRTAELLSCARTALKIARAQNPPPLETDWWVVEPSQLHLHNGAYAYSNSPLDDSLEDALSLLRAMQASLETLEGLVRRRGHTNDPTQEIAIKTKQLETDAQELNTIVQQLQATRSRSKQHKKHLEWIASWLQTFATQQSNRLKEVLKVRGTVLADQAQRRKMWNPQAKTNTTTPSSTRTARNKKTALESSPLFTMTPATSAKRERGGPARPPAYVNGRRVASANGDGANGANGNASSGNVVNGNVANGNATGGYGGATASSTPYSSQGSYGGGGYGGYYGGANSNMGMRQRRNNNNTNSTAMVQEQVQIRQQQRQTESRAETAKQAERTLAELGTVFGKMSTLIVQQGETLEKLEDDVECALGDVTAGQAEIQTLYSLKKGNRGLIIKVFAVVIFVILFMKLY